MRTIIKTAMTRSEWKMFAISVLLIIIEVWLETEVPAKMKDITMLTQETGSNMSQILISGGIMALYAAGAMIATILVVYFVSRIGAAVSTRLRAAIYDKTMKFSLEEMGDFGAASLITRCTDDVTQVQQFIASGLRFLVQSPLMAVIVIMKMMKGHIYWTIATIIAVLLIAILVSGIMIFATPAIKKRQITMDALANVVREHITGIRVVKAYNAEEYQNKRFEKVNQDVTDLKNKTDKIMAIFNPIANGIVYVLSISIYVLGAYIITEAGADEKLGLFFSMLSFISYTSLLLGSIVYLILVVTMLPNASVSVNRISEVIDHRISIVDGAYTKNSKDAGTIEFSHVSFQYPKGKGYVLKDVSFKVNRGETVAIIGATGSGKTSLLNLIPRLYDATEGEILVNGTNVKKYKTRELRNRIGYVPQKSFLFKGTIADNIGYGDNGRFNATLQDIKKAAEIGRADEFIRSKEQGYDTNVEQGGSNFSGGQRQRLTISRAICRDPEIYLFDDSFSALDYQTDSILRKKLRESAADATMVIVAQRISTIRNADKILVIDEGRLVGEGTHQQLMKNCKTYQEIASSQAVDDKEVG